MRPTSAYLFSFTRLLFQWDPLRELHLPTALTETGEITLDTSLDHVGYQLFKDGLLPTIKIKKYDNSSSSGNDTSISYGDPKKLEGLLKKERKEREEAIKKILKKGITVRRSVKESAIVIGCDEAGRGPLAGPVVGAAVCRIPISNFDNNFERLYEAKEQFPIFDSKSLAEPQRNFVFSMVTGTNSFFDLAKKSSFVVHHANGSSSPDEVYCKRTKLSSHKKLAHLPIKRLLSMQTPFLITYDGCNNAGNYLYFWSVGIANHSYIDHYNIFISSMHTMHRSAQGIWSLLSDPRFSHEKASRPKGVSISEYMFSRFCTVALHDHEKKYSVPHHIKLITGAKDFFDAEPVQPPLVLVDGNAIPEASYNLFCSDTISGNVQPIIEGDKRSLSIAAASCMAKVTRDEIMGYLATLYPKYNFEENKGYPVEQHMRLVEKHGLCPVHRKTFKPCVAALLRKGKKVD